MPGYRNLLHPPPFPDILTIHRSRTKHPRQRLYLLQSATFVVVAKEGQADLDSCMIAASRSRGLSRFSILGEGIDDPVLAGTINLDRSSRSQRKVSICFRKATGVKHLQLLLLLGAYYAFQPDNYNRHRDSVEYFLTKAIDESKLLKEGKLGRQAAAVLVKVYARGNDDKANSVCQTLITQCRQAGDKETEARYWPTGANTRSHGFHPGKKDQ